MAADRRRNLALIACILGSGITLLDSTVVGVALPTIQRHLGGGLAAQQWVSNAYLLTLGSLILLGGSLGDLFGERRIFSLGVGSFGLASLLCALAPTIGTLVAARALQGVAGALLMPSSLAVIVAIFPESERGAAIGTWTAWGGIATVLGPLAGGELLAIASWRVIFLINVPFVAGCLLLIRAAVPPSQPCPQDRRPHIDGAGATLCALGLGGPVFALIEQPRLGWGSPGVIVPALVGVALFALFLRREAHVRGPMLPLSLFADRNFAVGNVETFSMYAGLSINFFFLGLFLQQVGGYSPLKAGLATLPATLVLFALSRRAGALSARYGPRRFMGAGPLISCVGLFLFLRVELPVHYASEVLPALLIFSLGLAITVAPLTTAVLAALDQHQAGIGSAVNNAVARVAGLLGTAAVGAVVAAHFSASLSARLDGRHLSAPARAAVQAAERLTLGRPSTTGLPPAEGRTLALASSHASLSAFHLGLVVAAVLVGLGGVIGAIGIRDPERGQ